MEGDHITFVNDAGLKLLRATDASEVMGRGMLDIFAPSCHAKVLARIAQLEGDSCVLPPEEEKLCAQNGRIIPVDVSASSFTVDGKTVIQVICQDVSSRDEAQRAATRLAAIVESSDDAIVGMDLNGSITSWNRGATRIFGYTAKEMVGSPVLRLVPQERYHEETTILARIRDGQSTQHFETQRLRKDGKPIYVSISSSPIRNREGRIIGASKIARDITQIKEREREIARLNRLYAVLSQINQAIVWMPTRDILFRRVCRILVEDGGFRMAWIGWHDEKRRQIIPVASCGDHDRYLDQVAIYAHDTAGEQGICGRAFQTMLPCICNDTVNDPAMRPWRDEVLRRGLRAIAAFPILSGGRAVGTLSVDASEAGYFRDREIALLAEATSDISFALGNFSREAERQRAVEALSASEGRYRALFEYAPDGIVIADPTSVYLDANDSLCRMLGYTRDEIVGMHASQILAPEEIPFVDPALEAIKTQDGYHREWKFVRKDRTTFIAEVIATTMPDGNILAMIHDVTERRETQQKLTSALERLQLAVKAGRVGTWDYDPATGKVDWDDQMLALYGCARESLGDKTSLWESAVHPDDLPRVLGTYDAALKDGTETFQTDFRIRRASDGSERFMRGMGLVIRDQAERPLRMTGINWDVTEERRNELQLALALRQEQELAEKARSGERAKSEFLAVMSHEVRTPLNGILGFSELLVHAPNLPPECRDYAQTITSSGQALLRILDDVLDFSRLEAGRLEIEEAAFQPREILQDIRTLFTQQAREKKLKLTVRVDDDVPRLLQGDAGRLRQILLNLCGNAIKFTERGAVTFTLRGGPGAGEYQFAVQDSGPGIAPEQWERIFQPFTQADSSISRRHGGSGMGLSISRRLAELMGGTLDVASQPGAGAIFTLTVPLTKAVAPPEPKLDVPSRKLDVEFAREHPLRILVVEDDKVNLKLIVALLRRLGYEPMAAKNGREAVALQRAERAECVLMDIQMPEMDGIEATESIRALEKVSHEDRPSYIAALTANIFPNDRQRCFDSGMNSYLNKPVKMSVLAGVLAEACDFQKHKAN